MQQMARTSYDHDHHDDRRILSSPVEFPCGSVSPTNLLTSLTSVSSHICNFSASFFPTQRRNAIKTIRQVGIILMLLEDIREIPQHSAVITCLSELHFYLQKILFLLQDCTREGARLWMLTACQYVASRFRLLTGGVAVALQGLPLHQIEARRKVMTELLAKQVREMKLELDPDDERICMQAHLVLAELDFGIEPNLTDTKQVLEYLKINTWTDCDREITFLRDEIVFQWYERDKQGVPTLSSLAGWLSYCRAVIFESETVGFHQNPTESKSKRCLSIFDTFKPMSRKESHAMYFLSRFIAQRLESGTTEQKIKAAYEMCLVTGYSKFNNDRVVAAGTVPHLLNLLSTNDKSMQENVFTALGLVSHLLVVKDAIMENEGLKTILKVLKEGLSPRSRVSAAMLIYSLSCRIKNDEELSAEVIPCLVELVKEGTRAEKRNAAAALFKLLSKDYPEARLVKENYERAVEANIVRVLHETLASDDDDNDVMTGSLRVLASLTGDDGVGTEAVLKEWAQLQPVIIRILKATTKIRERKECCTSILLSVLEKGTSVEDVKRVLAGDKCIMSELFSLYSDQSCIRGHEAGSLIGILQDFLLSAADVYF